MNIFVKVIVIPETTGKTSGAWSKCLQVIENRIKFIK